MNILWGFLITAAVTAVAVAALLLVRRRAPEDGFFTDGDRAAGVFGVLATGFALLLGLIVFLAFTSYDQSRSGAEREALILVQQVENAQFFPQPAGADLTGELVCYGRSVVHEEWDQMTAGDQGDSINPWAVAMFRTLQGVEPETDTQQSAYDKWLDQTSEREEARLDRIHGAVGVIPATLWIVLFFIAVVIFVFTLFFADPSERAFVQGLLIGSVVSVMVVLLLLLSALNDPFHDGVGGLQARGDGAVARPDRPGARRRRRGRRDPVRRARASDAMTAEGSSGPNWVELAATLLLALATVATAWSGYQSTRWNGEQAKAAARANALRIESAKAADLANTQAGIDVATFTQWANAYATDETELADFYFKRFRPEFRPAVDAWVATRPLKNPDAPLTPFAMPEYELAANVEADRLERRGRGERRAGAPQHPARLELRARRRALRLRALLRRHERQAHLAEAPGRRCSRSAARCSSAPPPGSRRRPSASASDAQIHPDWMIARRLGTAYVRAYRFRGVDDRPEEQNGRQAMSTQQDMNVRGGRRVELLLPMRTVLLVAAAVLVLAAFAAIGDTFLIVFIGIFLALVFEYPVRYLMSKTKLSRGLAAAVVVLGTALGVLILLLLFLAPLVGGVRDFLQDLPATVEQLRNADGLAVAGRQRGRRERSDGRRGDLEGGAGHDQGRARDRRRLLLGDPRRLHDHLHLHVPAQRHREPEGRARERADAGRGRALAGRVGARDRNDLALGDRRRRHRGHRRDDAGSHRLPARVELRDRTGRDRRASST